MTEKHTPTPWQRIGWKPCGIYGPGDLSTAKRICRIDDRVEHDDDAAFLLKAVNSHTALVAALRASRENTKEVMTALLGAGTRDHLLLADRVHKADDIARAALSAEGEKDAPKDERHLTLEEQDTFSQAIRGSGTVRQTIPIAPKDDGWIEWRGGECPVRPDQRVDVRLRSGQECFNDTPDWNWGACAHGGDIVAYRVVKP
jgi:hypothetical protein